jgi:small subunit ribosomal protein S19e
MDARSVPSSGSRAPNTRHLRVGSMPPETFLPVCVFPGRDASRPLGSHETQHHRVTNERIADHLSPNSFYSQMEVPTWVDIVKTASYKELAPYDPDWFYIRAASMARKLYVSGNMGVGAFRKNYGGARNDGVCRFHHAIGSGSVARAVLKQLEAVGVVEKGPKGRRITPSGQRDLDRIAGRVKVPSA